MSLGFVRNRTDCWQTVLRDLNYPQRIDKKLIDLKCKNVTVYPIWQEDTTNVKIVNEKIEISNINYGTIFKMDKLGE